MNAWSATAILYCNCYQTWKKWWMVNSCFPEDFFNARLYARLQKCNPNSEWTTTQLLILSLAWYYYYYLCFSLILLLLPPLLSLSYHILLLSFILISLWIPILHHTDAAVWGNKDKVQRACLVPTFSPMPFQRKDNAADDGPVCFWPHGFWYF